MKTLKIYVALALCSTMFFACNRVMVGERNVVDNAKPTDAQFSSKTEPMGSYQVSEFGKWDADNNGGISHKEFLVGIMNDNLFFEWDTDNSGYMSNTEFNLGVFSQWDQDGNKKIDSEEWATRGTVWDNPTVATSTFNAWGPTVNKPIICREFEDGYVKCSNYMPWDSNIDGLLDINEFNEGVFKSLDTNLSGSVEAREFDRYTGGTSMNDTPRNAAR